MALEPQRTLDQFTAPTVLSRLTVPSDPTIQGGRDHFTAGDAAAPGGEMYY